MSDEERVGERRMLEFETELDATPAAVWRALTEAEGLMGWFPLEARVAPGEGGSVWLSWGEGMEWSLDISVWEPERRLVLRDRPSAEAQEWLPEAARAEAAAAPLAVEFTIEGRRGKTVLRLVHSGFGPSSDWDDLYDGTHDGWSIMLRQLRAYLDRHGGAPRRLAWARPRVNGSPAEVWALLTGPEGLALRPPALAEGAPYRLRLGDSDVAGRVELWHPPYTFVGSLHEPGGSMLAFEMESRKAGEGWRCGLWLSTWGVPEEEVARLQAALDATVEGVFPEAAGAERAG